MTNFALFPSVVFSLVAFSTATRYRPANVLLRYSVDLISVRRSQTPTDLSRDSKFFQQLLAEDVRFFGRRELLSASMSFAPSETVDVENGQSSLPSIPVLPDGAQPQIPPLVSISPVPTIVSDMPSDSPSVVPSSNPTPTLFQHDVVFTCTPNGIGVTSPPFEEVSLLRFKLLYLVESNAGLDDFKNKLERFLILTATAGALQCSTGGDLFNNRDSDSSLSLVPVNTTITTAPCDSDVSRCLILETEFNVVVDQDVDPQVAVFLGNLFVRDEIDEGSVSEAIPTINRTEYIGPQPLLPTIVSDDDAINRAEVPTLQANERVTVSAWTVGAVLAMSVGGVVAIGAWFRNRRVRNQNHMQLVEDEMSMASPSMGSP